MVGVIATDAPAPRRPWTLTEGRAAVLQATGNAVLAEGLTAANPASLLRNSSHRDEDARPRRVSDPVGGEVRSRLHEPIQHARIWIPPAICVSPLTTRARGIPNGTRHNLLRKAGIGGAAVFSVSMRSLSRLDALASATSGQKGAYSTRGRVRSAAARRTRTTSGSATTR